MSKKKDGIEKKARRAQRKQKRYGDGSGFCMDDLHTDRNSDFEREARRFERRYLKD